MNIENNKLDADLAANVETRKKTFIDSLKNWCVQWWPMLAALAIIMAAMILYFIIFGSPVYPDCVGRWDEERCIAERLADGRSAWGQFGDFIGGTVNPVIGLLTVILLLNTIRQQQKAIAQTELALNQAGRSLGHAENALKQNETAINQAYEALKQNAEALKITREEIEIAREEIGLSRDINKKTEESLTAQVVISRSQNYLSNYFEHRNQYINYVESVFEEYEIKSYKIFVRSLHAKGYPGAKYGDLDVSFALLSSFWGDIKTLQDYFNRVNDNSDETRRELAELLERVAIGRYKLYRGCISLVHTKIQVVSGTINSNDVTHYSTKYLNVKTGLREFLNSTIVIQKAITFDGDFISMHLNTTIDLLKYLIDMYPILSVTEHGGLMLDFNKFLEVRGHYLLSLQSDLAEIETEINRRIERK